MTPDPQPLIRATVRAARILAEQSLDDIQRQLDSAADVHETLMRRHAEARARVAALRDAEHSLELERATCDGG